MKLLFATDGSAGAETALDLLLALPLPETARLTVLSVPVHQYGVGADLSGMSAEIHGLESTHASEVADQARARLAADGREVTVRTDEGPPAQTIGAVADEIGADLVIVGSRGLGGMLGLLLGSTARAIVRYTDRPVLVVKDRRIAPRRILLALDGAADATSAREALGMLPLPADITVRLLHLSDAPARTEDGWTERILERAAAIGADLIVIGPSVAARDAGLLRGRLVDEVLMKAHCAVLVAQRTPVGRGTQDRPPEEALI